MSTRRLVRVDPAEALTSDNQRADDTRTELGGLVDERLGDKVCKSNGEGPHAKFVCSAECNRCGLVSTPGREAT